VIFNLPKYHVIDAPSHHNRGGSDSDPEPHRDGVPGRTEAKPGAGMRRTARTTPTAQPKRA